MMNKENKPKPKLIFTHEKNKKPEEPVAADTYLEDTAKAIGESKVAIDSYAEEGGGNRSERFQKAKKNTEDTT